MDSILGNKFKTYHTIVCFLGLQSTFYSSISMLNGVYSTLLQFNCSSGEPNYDSRFSQGQISSLNVQYQLCDNSLSELTSIVFFLGMAVGALAVGPMSDGIGRVPTIAIGAGCAAISGLVGNYCHQFWLHLLMRCVCGCATAMMQCSIHVYGNEVHCMRHRAKFNFLWGSGMSVGSIASSAIAYFSKNHQHYTLFGCSVSLLTLATSVWLPESPLWLLERGRFDRALSSLRRIAKIDCRAPPSEQAVRHAASDLGADEQQQKKSLWQSLKQLELRTRFHLLALVPYALTITINTYGFSFVISKVVSNVYLYMSLKALALLPSAAVMNLAPRGITIVTCGFCCGVLCLSVAGVAYWQPDMAGAAGWAAIGLGLPGTFFGGVGFAVLLTSAAELFPTSVRNTCMGWLYLMTRAGAAVPPALAFVPSMPLRILLLALPMLVTCWPAIVVPDTRKQQLQSDTKSAEDEENKAAAGSLLQFTGSTQLRDGNHLAASLAGSLPQL